MRFATDRVKQNQLLPQFLRYVTISCFIIISSDKNLICLANLVISLIGGAVIYLILGHKSQICKMKDLKPCDQIFDSSGIDLIFKVGCRYHFISSYPSF